MIIEAADRLSGCSSVCVCVLFPRYELATFWYNGARW